ncbi:hypothetical protein Tco_1023205 [Tanacetum coccineum]
MVGNANSKKMQKAILKQQFKRDSFYQDQGAGKKEQNQNCLLTMGDGVVNWGEHKVAGKGSIMHSWQLAQLGDQEAQILAYSQVVKKLEATWETGNESCKRKGTIAENIRFMEIILQVALRIINSGLSSFGKPLYSRFTKTNDFKGVPHPLSEDYTPKPQEEIDESLYCTDLLENFLLNIVDLESEISRVPSEVYVSTPITTTKKYGLITDKINHANQFVPRPVQLNAGRTNINSVRPNINTGRQNVNSVKSNVNTGRTNVNPVRPRVNTGSSNVNTVRSEPVPYQEPQTAFSPKRPQ